MDTEMKETSEMGAEGERFSLIDTTISTTMEELPQISTTSNGNPKIEAANPSGFPTPKKRQQTEALSETSTLPIVVSKKKKMVTAEVAWQPCRQQ